MNEKEKPEVREIVIRFERGSDLVISKFDIEKMLQATEALEELDRAKRVATRLASLLP